MDFLIYAISFLFGLGLLGFFVLFAAFTKHATQHGCGQLGATPDFAHMLHAGGISNVCGGTLVRRSGTTFQLTRSEVGVFFRALPDSVTQLLYCTGHAHVLYLGEVRADGPTPYPIFNIVCTGPGGPVIDPTPFSPSAPSVHAIAQKYDKLAAAQLVTVDDIRA